MVSSTILFRQQLAYECSYQAGNYNAIARVHTITQASSRWFFKQFPLELGKYSTIYTMLLWKRQVVCHWYTPHQNSTWYIIYEPCPIGVYQWYTPPGHDLYITYIMQQAHENEREQEKGAKGKKHRQTPPQNWCYAVCLADPLNDEQKSVDVPLMWALLSVGAIVNLSPNNFCMMVILRHIAVYTWLFQLWAQNHPVSHGVYVLWTPLVLVLLERNMDCQAAVSYFKIEDFLFLVQM